MARRPKASDQHWHRIFHSPNVTCYEAHDYRDFYYKVVPKNNPIKYFWGETAHMDYQRYALDQNLEKTF